MWAQAGVQSAFKKYVKVQNQLKVTGAMVAQEILNKNGIFDVTIVETPGTLSDHYDPSKKRVALSRDIYHGTTIASISVAAHEVGHAMQHAQSYYPLVFRSGMFPLVNICSKMAMPLVLIGLLISSFGSHWTIILDIGIFFYAGVVLFHFVTLPVEFNASSRAKAQLSDGFVIEQSEIEGCKKMLHAAAMTYVAAAAVALLQLIRLLLIRNSRR